MLRGQIGIEARPSTVFVFEGLVANVVRPTVERAAIRMRRWELALDCWFFDTDVLNYIEMLVNRFHTPVEIITSRPHGFVKVLSDRLDTMEVSVREIKSGSYEYFSPRYAVDPEITTVYDPDPAHRMGYGFKVREFHIGNR